MRSSGMRMLQSVRQPFPRPVNSNFPLSSVRMDAVVVCPDTHRFVDKTESDRSRFVYVSQSPQHLRTRGSIDRWRRIRDARDDRLTRLGGSSGREMVHTFPKGGFRYNRICTRSLDGSRSVPRSGTVSEIFTNISL